MYADPRFRPLSIEAVTLLQEGRVSDAVKAVRESEGLGLKDAKARVDAYVAREPLLRAQLDARRHAKRRNFLWFLVVDLLITAGIIYWLYYRGSF
jgi:hypothetical protein